MKWHHGRPSSKAHQNDGLQDTLEAVVGSCHRLGDSAPWQASPPPDPASISTASQLCRSKVQVTCDKAGTDGQKSVPTTEIDCFLLLGLLIMKCYKLERQMAFGLLKLQPEPRVLFFKHLRTFLQLLLFYRGDERRKTLQIWNKDLWITNYSLSSSRTHMSIISFLCGKCLM